MELRHIYALSEILRDKIDKEDLPKDTMEKMEITLKFSPITFYGIDKEFYFMTHNNSYEGFVHSEVVNATINGIKFVLLPETIEKTEMI